MSMSPTNKRIWRSHLTAYLEVAEDYRRRRDYTQARPYSGLGLPASEEQQDDCSSYTAKAFYRANHLTRVATVRDPLGAHFNRTGDTDTCLSYMSGGGGKRIVLTPSVVLWPGDVAIFDNPRTGRRTDHMMVCKIKGTQKTARWSSHGHESTIFERDAPEPVSLFYASSVLTLTHVYRPTELV